VGKSRITVTFVEVASRGWIVLLDIDELILVQFHMIVKNMKKHVLSLKKSGLSVTNVDCDLVRNQYSLSMSELTLVKSHINVIPVK